MFTITFSVPTLDVLTKIADAVKSVTGSATAPTVKAVHDVTVKTEKVTEKAAKEEPKQAMPTFLGKKETAASQEALFKKVKDIATEVVRTINRDTGVAILKQFGVESTSALSPDHYHDFIRAANEVLENHGKKKNEDIL